jgi:hypothetical protein
MKLSNLEISATARLTQPDVGDEDQTLDIEFDVSKGATISNELYALAFYNMLNGYVDGEDGGPVVTGFKFTAYDEAGGVVMESVPAKVDMVVDESYTRLEALSETVSTDTSADVYVAKIGVSYVANDEDVESEFMVLESMAPATCIFSEEIPASDPVAKGILIDDGMATKFTMKFALSWRN